MQQVRSADFRRRARILVLQSLFACDIRKDDNLALLRWLAVEEAIPDESLVLAQTLLLGIKATWDELGRTIQRYAPAWPVNQLSLIDRNILRIALFELLHHSDTPHKTAINEAVELAKMFGSESSSRFINGVLGSVMAGLERGELKEEKPVPEGR